VSRGVLDGRFGRWLKLDNLGRWLQSTSFARVEDSSAELKR
jgi:hypothetical protein